MSVEDTVEHCIEKSLQEKCRYSIEESEDNENVVILHAPSRFLTSDLTEELRKRLIFVDATSSSYREGYSTMYFLHYLEPEEDTFMDELAEPISTPGTDHRLPMLYRHPISEEELEQVEERLEGSALELFQRLVENAADREKFYEIFNEDYGGADHTKIRKALQDIGGYRIIDIRKSEMARKHAKGENQQC
mgnify:CR=1 FL=1